MILSKVLKNHRPISCWFPRNSHFQSYTCSTYLGAWFVFSQLYNGKDETLDVFVYLGKSHDGRKLIVQILGMFWTLSLCSWGYSSSDHAVGSFVVQTLRPVDGFISYLMNVSLQIHSELPEEPYKILTYISIRHHLIQKTAIPSSSASLVPMLWNYMVYLVLISHFELFVRTRQ